MVELVVAENCFHVLRVKLVERPRIEVVERNEVLPLRHHLVQLTNQPVPNRQVSLQYMLSVVLQYVLHNARSLDKV